jgi:hypothetical protein
MKCISYQLKELSEKIEDDLFWEKVGEGKAFLSQRCRKASPFKIEKLVIEIEGDGKLAKTGETKIFADGKQLGSIKTLDIHADSSQVFADVKLVQRTASMKEFKKITPKDAKALRSIGHTGISEMVPEVTDNPITIQWVKDYDKLKGSI